MERMRKKQPGVNNDGVTAGVVADLRTIPIALIDEPQLPARETMDGDGMRELELSMQQLGLLSPIVVVANKARFRTVAGHRRLLAARNLHWQNIRALVYPEGWKDQLAAMLHENIIREDLNPAQEAIFFAQLLEQHKLDEAGLCAAVRRSPDYVADRLKLLRGDERIFESLRSGHISFAVARVLNRFPNEDMRRYFFEQALRSGTSARVVEQWLADWQAQQVPAGTQLLSSNFVPTVPTIEPSAIACFLCGGNKDPYNLETVMIHRWELMEIQRRMATAVVDEKLSESEKSNNQ